MPGESGTHKAHTLARKELMKKKYAWMNKR